MKNWYAIAPKPDHAQTEIAIFDEIGMYGISAKSFINDLSRIPSDHTVLLKIHSPGGEVFDGNAIFNALKPRTADVIIHIEGLAASMATVNSLAGHHVKMAANGFYMIHNPWGVAMGDAGGVCAGRAWGIARIAALGHMETVAYVAAWLEAATQRATREQHMATIPSPQDVEEFLVRHRVATGIDWAARGRSASRPRPLFSTPPWAFARGASVGHDPFTLSPACWR